MAKPSKYKYYPQATVKDEMDGSVYTLGMTVETLNIEISGNSHPFYTGKEALVDTAGRIDKFKKRTEAAKKAEKTDKKERKVNKTKMSFADLMKKEEPKAEKKPKAKAEKKQEETIEEKPAE